MGRFSLCAIFFGLLLFGSDCNLLLDRGQPFQTVNLAIAAETWEVLIQKAQKAEETGALFEAKDKYQKVLSLHPTPETEAALQRVTKKIETARRLREEGKRLLKEKKYGEALEKLKASLVFFPDERLKAYIKKYFGEDVDLDRLYSGPYMSFELDTDRTGSDYKSFDLEEADPALCMNACRKEEKCKAYTYVKPGIQGASARCWLKYSVPSPNKNSCCISGVKQSPKKDDAVFVENGPYSFRLKKSLFEPTERITLFYTAAPDTDPSSWIGLFEASAPHKNMNQSDNYDIKYCYMEKTEGNCTFSAPNKEGDYDFRMFERTNGQEVANIGFTVKVNRDAAQLKLGKRRFEPTEKITLFYKRSKYFGTNPWIGLFEASAPHKNMNESDNYDIKYCYMKKTEGNCTFSAPNKEGDYDFRMFERTNGLEVASIGFQVTKQKEAAKTDAPKYVFEKANYWYYGYKGFENFHDMQKCAELCDKDPRCKVASFHGPNAPAQYRNLCILRDKVGPRHTEQPDIYSWVKPAAGDKRDSQGKNVARQGKQSRYGSYVLEKANYWFHGIKVYENFHDPQKCAELCDLNPKCKVATFHGPNGPGKYKNMCILRDKVGPRHTEQPDTVSWVKP